MSQAQVEKKVWIPDLSEMRARELASRISPVVLFIREDNGSLRRPSWKELSWSREDGLFSSSEDTALHYIESIDDWFETAYTFNPMPTERAAGLDKICDIETHHRFQNKVVFGASVAEVLAQIPEEHLDSVVAFQIIDYPKTNRDFDKSPEALEALNNDHHIAKTRLYARKP